MKKRLMAILGTVLAFAMLLPTMAFAAEIPAEGNDCLSIIEEDLSSQQTDVVAELDKMISEYSVIKEQSLNENDVKNAEEIIGTLKELRSEYLQNESDATTYEVHPVFATEVAAVIAYFNVNGYKLSAELLSHMKANEVKDSDYTPTHGDIVLQSSVFTGIANGHVASGSGEFPNQGSKTDKDLYNAIHFFNYEKPSANSKTVTISDRYDFAANNPGSIAGVAMDMMYKAQEAGYLTPFYTKITETA